jgi:hypothetical protein
MQTMIINENRLNLADAAHRKYLAEQMERHFFGDGADRCRATCRRRAEWQPVGHALVGGARFRRRVRVRTPPGRCQQADVRRTAGEEAIGDDADDLVDAAFQGNGIGDLEPVEIDDQIAVVGDASPRAAAARRRVVPAARRTWAKAIGITSTAAESDRAPAPASTRRRCRRTFRPPRRRSFPARAATALDHLQRTIDLVGAVHVDRQAVDLVEIERPGSRGLRGAFWSLRSLPRRRGSAVRARPVRSMKKLAVEPVPTPTISPSQRARGRLAPPPASIRPGSWSASAPVG